jgi:hypothetical protein
MEYLVSTTHMSAREALQNAKERREIRSTPSSPWQIPI